MAKTPTSIPVTTENQGPMPAGQAPWYPLATLRDEMDRLFDDFFTGWPMTSFRRRRGDTDPWRRFQGMFEATFPTADVVAGEKKYKITAELPGMSEHPRDRLAGDVLTLKARRRRSMRRRARTATSRNGVTARSSAPSPCQRTPTQRRSMRCASAGGRSAAARSGLAGRVTVRS